MASPQSGSAKLLNLFSVSHQPRVNELRNGWWDLSIGQ